MKPLKLFTSKVKVITPEEKARFYESVRNPENTIKHVAEINDSSCEACGSTEDLVESGGQFCGGDWYLCKKCDDASKRFTEFMKSEEFKNLLNKHGIDKQKYSN